MNPNDLIGKGENIWNVFAGFGAPHSSSSIRGLHAATLKIIERFGVKVNVIATHKGGRFGQYRRANPRLHSVLDSDPTVCGFALGYVPTEQGTDFLQYGLIGTSTTERGIVVTGSDKLFLLNSRIAVALTREIMHVYPITYGYGYRVDHFYGPEFHAVGIIMIRPADKSLPTLEPKQRERMAKWANMRARALDEGLLRDVFPLNVLSNIHMKHQIDGVPLLEWIEQDPSRGRIEPISPDLVGWHVKEEKCLTVGDKLEAAGLLASS